jgi:hypothetical protein
MTTIVDKVKLVLVHRDSPDVETFPRGPACSRRGFLFLACSILHRPRVVSGEGSRQGLGLGATESCP